MSTSSEGKQGRQRLSVERLNRWRALDYGMFLHYGMSTFSDKPTPALFEHLPPTAFHPDRQDPEQWVQVARDCGMKYVILTTKHASGFCLWPSRHTDYHVGNSAVKTDLVEAFVTACSKHGLQPALYYAGPTGLPGGSSAGGTFDKDEWPSYATREQQDVRLADVEELLTQYGVIEEIWFDGPSHMGAQARHELYKVCASLAPDTVVAMNGAWEDSGKYPYVKPRRSWPTDLIVIEAAEPPIWDTDPWRKMQVDPEGRLAEKPLDYYIPVESCSIVHQGGRRGWWWGPELEVRSDEELLGMRLLTRARNANLVLNCTPDRHGLIPKDQIDALMRIETNLTQLGWS
jgi:alpha-L-fucosidase